MAMNMRKSKIGDAGPAPAGKSRLAPGLLIGVLALALAFQGLAASPASGKVLEELNYQVDVWIWQDALKAKVVFREVGPGRYRADLDGRTQGLLSVITGNWGGSLSSEMEYSQGKLQPLVYREISNKKGARRVMEYRFNYAEKKVELWKQDKSGNMTKNWETDLTRPMYDPLTFFYNRRLTGQPWGEKAGETLKFQGIPYPKPDEMTLRVGEKNTDGRKIMLELENRVFRDERSQVYAYLDADGVPTKAWTKVMKFGNVNIKLLPGGKRFKKEELTGVADQPRQSDMNQPSAPQPETALQ
ncbi:MAG: DUF3108 domain-containing protein [Desulfobaccales bacterium]